MKAHYNKLTNKQMDIVKEQTEKYFNELLDRYNRTATMQILCLLHFEYGFGQKRLEDFTRKFFEMQEKELDKYELPKKDTAWLCEKMLTDSGIDVDKIMMGE